MSTRSSGAYAGESAKAYGVVPPASSAIGRVEILIQARRGEGSAEAGWRLHGLTLVALNSEPEQVAAAQIIQANLADVGITVKIIPTDSGPYWNLGLE